MIRAVVAGAAGRMGMRIIHMIQQSQEIALSVPQIELTPEALATLSSDLLGTLEQAVNRSDMSKITAIIEEIRTHNIRVADGLAMLAEEFQYEEILYLLQKTNRRDERELIR